MFELVNETAIWSPNLKNNFAVLDVYYILYNQLMYYILWKLLWNKTSKTNSSSCIYSAKFEVLTASWSIWT